MRTTPGKRAGERGQAYVETVVMLPVLLTIFLGLYFFSELVRERMTAVEAARYVAWEGLWYVRETNPSRQMKSDVQLRRELGAMGLGVNLIDVKSGADASFRRSLNQYTSDVGGASATVDPPQIVGDFFPSSFDASQLTGPVNGLVSQLGPLAGLVGTGAFLAHDFFANQTDWVDEASGAVYTARLTYHFKGAGFFGSLPAITMTEYASLLTHPLNIKRSDNQGELDDLIGAGSTFSCFGSNKGHIFDLWLFPSGPLVGNNGIASAVSTGLSGGKCFFASLGSVLGLADFLGTQLGFKMPSGTLKEFPELHQ